MRSNTGVESLEPSGLNSEGMPSGFDPDRLIEPTEKTPNDAKVTQYDSDKVVEPVGSTQLDTSATPYDPDDLVGADGTVGGDPRLKDVGGGDDYERFSGVLETRAQRVYVDDNGDIYRLGDELIPNSEYEINGYKYMTDDLGRISSAEGHLHFRDRETRLYIKDSKEAIGKGAQRETDDRGHLIADWFDGGNGLENIVPMDGELNKGDFNKLENRLGDALKEGCEVRYKIEPRYSDDSHRPSEFVVTDVIDGETTVTVFRNEGTGSREQ